MQIHQVKRNTARQYSKTVGRGGKRGKTSGRGTKGQNARAGRKKFPEIREWIKKFPKMRGRGKNSNKSIVAPTDLVIMNLKDLANTSGAINPSRLVELGLISKRSGKIPSVKILGVGDAPKGLEVSGCKISKSAKDAIEKSGGSVK